MSDGNSPSPYPNGCPMTLSLATKSNNPQSWTSGVSSTTGVTWTPLIIGILENPRCRSATGATSDNRHSFESGMSEAAGATWGYLVYSSSFSSPSLHPPPHSFSNFPSTLSSRALRSYFSNSLSSPFPPSSEKPLAPHLGI